MEEGLIPLWRILCQNPQCGLPTVGTAGSLARWPHCAFCGEEATIEPVGNEILEPGNGTEH